MSLTNLLKYCNFEENKNERHTAEYDVNMSVSSLLFLAQNHCCGSSSPETIFLSWIIDQIENIKVTSGPLVEKIFDIDKIRKMKNPLTSFQCHLWNIPPNLDKAQARKYADKYPSLFFKKDFKENEEKKLSVIPFMQK